MIELTPTPVCRSSGRRSKPASGCRSTTASSSTSSADLFTLGELANLVRERKNGNFAYYNVNTHLNPTNVCVYRCTFCAFRADLKSDKGYVMSDEQILRARRRGGTARRDRDAHRRRPAPSAAVRVVSERHPHHPPGASAAAPQGVHGGRMGLVRPADRPADARSAGRVQGRRPRQPARRRGGDFSSRSARQDLRAQGRRRATGSHPPRGARARPALQRHDALRPHRGSRGTASTTCAGCANCRTRRAASRRSSRWRSIRTTPGWRTSRSRAACSTSRRWPSAG